jgi:hypothetical protein
MTSNDDFRFWPKADIRQSSEFDVSAETRFAFLCIATALRSQSVVHLFAAAAN